jgi:outer membrane protein assembly factor BamB
VHHDFRVLPGGEIVALTRVAHINPRVSDRAPILEDFVSYLDADGVERRRISLLESYENASGDHDWRAAARTFWSKERTRRLASNPGDVFHTNAVRVLDGRLVERLPAFAEGNLLLSMCHLDAIAVVDPRLERVVWSLDGIFALQHDPTILADGHLMVFDNNWRPRRSRIVVLDPLDGETVWEYGVTEDQTFHSRTCGTAAELPNGNLLITSSDSGRAFEITRESEIVWEFYNPHRAGERNEYIATLFELVRLPADFSTGWLPR